MSKIWEIDQHRARGRIKLGSVVVDIGACVGDFAIPACEAGAVVLAVEPDPGNCQALENAGVRTIWAGVGDVDGACRFVKNAPPTGGWIAPDKNGHVPMFSLAAVLNFTGHEMVDVLKVDCEGGEYALFEGADEATLRRVRFAAVELHEWTTDDEPRHEGWGHHDEGPAMPDAAVFELRRHLGVTHTVEVNGDFLFAELRP